MTKFFFSLYVRLISNQHPKTNTYVVRQTATHTHTNTHTGEYSIVAVDKPQL